MNRTPFIACGEDLDHRNRAALGDWVDAELRREALQAAVLRLQASPADIPGLWNAPGYAELTTNQLLQFAGEGPVQPSFDPARTPCEHPRKDLGFDQLRGVWICGRCKTEVQE